MKMNRKGFTLVEIMIVVLIIGILAAIAIPNFIKSRRMSQANSCIANMKQIIGAAEQYKMANKKNPASVADLCSDTEGFIKGKEPTCPANDGTYTFSATDTDTSVTCGFTDATIPTCSHKCGRLSCVEKRRLLRGVFFSVRER